MDFIKVGERDIVEGDKIKFKDFETNIETIKESWKKSGSVFNPEENGIHEIIYKTLKKYGDTVTTVIRTTSVDKDIGFYVDADGCLTGWGISMFQ